VLCLTEDRLELLEGKEKIVETLTHEKTLEEDITTKLYYRYPYKRFQHSGNVLYDF